MKIVSSKPTITRKDLEGVLDCLINDELTNGKTLKTFENEVSSVVELKYALATNSLLSAYYLCFKALDIDSESEVIIPSLFHQAPLGALSIAGGKPVLVDCAENSLFPSVDDIKSKITDKTKAIITGHLFGFHADISEILTLQVPVIEDISHSIGTEYNDEPVGKKGSIAVTAFSPSMILTTGNGGMALTNNSRYYSTMKELRGTADRISLDCSMTDFQAAMGLTQLMKLKSLLKRRKEIAKIYSDALRITQHKQIVPYNENFAYQSFPVLINAPSDKIIKYWKKNGIEIVKSIESPLHLLMGEKGFDYPNSDRIAKKLYSLPVYPTLTKKEIEKISKALSSFI